MAQTLRGIAGAFAMGQRQIEQGKMIGVAEEQRSQAGLALLLRVFQGQGQLGKGVRRWPGRRAPPHEHEEEQPQRGVNVAARHRNSPVNPSLV